jgi:hypothetical protein
MTDGKVNTARRDLRGSWRVWYPKLSAIKCSQPDGRESGEKNDNADTWVDPV